jgi:hypothetical protein
MLHRDRTVVEHSAHFPKVKVSNPATKKWRKKLQNTVF